MQFPVTLHFFGCALPAHTVAEGTAFLVGFGWYVVNRLRGQSSPINPERNIWLIAFLMVGAIIGSRTMAWIQNPFVAARLLQQHPVWMLIHGGQEVLGGLLGGWMGVEVGKKVLHIRHSTGDAMVFPVMCGMALGRIGCFLTGLADGTCGLPTHLPWGVDFGDGIPRQPVQLYDILFLIVFGIILARMPKSRVPGARFRLFMAGYAVYRLLIDFLKPRPVTWLGLSAIQWLALGLGVYCAWWLVARRVWVWRSPPAAVPQPAA